ncbi:MAG: leucine-rich repeat protein [Tidjanibacter sp.]|nr:leucine-rich repeat protein [Tidjanibacter sp.]
MKFRNLIYTLILAMGLVACNNPHSDEIVFPNSEGRITLEVSAKNPLLKVDESGLAGEVTFLSRGGEIVLDVLTNQSAWSYTKSQDSSWLTAKDSDYFLRLSTEENNTGEIRTATITITAEREGERVEFVLTVSQNFIGQAELGLSTSSLRMEAHTSLRQVVRVESSDDEWEFDCTCSWLLIEKNGEELILTADDNRRNAQRETFIRLFVEREGAVALESVLTVRQDGNAFVTLASYNVATDDEGAKKSLAVKANPELEWAVESDGSSWFSVKKLSAEELEVEINPNDAGLERKGSFTIEVGDENNSAQATVKVHQIGTDTEELIYEIEIVEPFHLITAAPVLTTSTGGSIAVDWGDGSEVETFESRRGTHTYKEPGLYTISITGEAHQLKFSDGSSFAPELKNIISWGQLGLKNAADMCLGCSGLESIPNDVAGSFANVKSFLGAFSACESLKEIPAGLFRHATLAKNFEDCFSHSRSISEIPAGLFDNCTAAERFINTFYATGTGYVSTSSTLPNFSEVKAMVQQGVLRAIPEGLFDKCTAAQKFDYVFGATAIESIPEGLFANNSAATIFTGAFSACVNLTEIPAGLMRGATGALDIKYMFAGCDGIKEIPTGMFTNNSAVTNLEYIFYKTGISKLSKGTFEGLSGVKTVGAVFQDCLSLCEIEEGAFDGLSAAKSFKYCFSGCTSLRSIPEGLFAGLTAAYEFKSTFEDSGLESIPAGLFADARDYSGADLTYMLAGCKNLKTVPAGLFDTFTTVTSPGFRSLFEHSGIESVPAGLFAKSVKITTGFEDLFYMCEELKTIEGSIFPTSENVSSLAYTFSGCSSLESLPADLFTPLAASKTKFTATFYGCTSLASLPEGLFAENTAATQFTNTFNSCTSLKSIPANLLGSKEKVTTVKGIFDGCSSLESIPAGLFAECPAITSFERAFAECSSLRSLPAELFAAIGTKSSSVTFAECFQNCSSLESLPAGLFDTVRRINYVDYCFDGCSSLKGESPYTIVVDSEGVEQKVHLYERVKGDDFATVPSSSSAHTKCFAGCNGLTDYDNIPSDWK